MKYIATLIFLLLCSAIAFSQSGNSSNNVVEDYAKVFTKAPIMPEYKYGTTALEDTISKTLLERRAHFKKASAKYIIQVNTVGAITNLKCIIWNDNSTLRKEFETALENTSYMWTPAQINGKAIVAVKVLNVVFEKDQLRIVGSDFVSGMPTF